jgi:hypothetical protein
MLASRLTKQREASTLADLKAERAALGAKGRQIETEATPIKYVAEIIGADRQRARDPVADRSDGLLLRPARHCAHGRGFGKALTPAVCPPPHAGEGSLLAAIPIEPRALDDFRHGLRALAIGQMVEHLLACGPIVVGLRLGSDIRRGYTAGNPWNRRSRAPSP